MPCDTGVCVAAAQCHTPRVGSNGQAQPHRIRPAVDSHTEATNDINTPPFVLVSQAHQRSAVQRLDHHRLG